MDEAEAEANQLSHSFEAGMWKSRVKKDGIQWFKTTNIFMSAHLRTHKN